MPIEDLPEDVIMSLSAHSIQGKRNHMEDFYDIGYQLKDCDQPKTNNWQFEYFYLAIYDGHGGSEASLFARKHLAKFIVEQKEFKSDDDQDVMRAIRLGFAKTQQEMFKDSAYWPKTQSNLPSTAGTTASILFIKNGKFYTGHVGDTRIVISQECPETQHWVPHRMTVDHKPEAVEEMARIQRTGGDVRRKLGISRVVWRRPVLHQNLTDVFDKWLKHSEKPTNKSSIHTYPVDEKLVESYQTIPFLAIARSLGDFWSINPYSGQYTVSPEPDISCRPISPNDKAIILATDGLWNVINSPLSVRLLQELNIIKNNKRDEFDDQYFNTDNFYDVVGLSSYNYARSLVYIAYQIWERKRLRSDNITVVVALLHDILGAQATVGKVHATRRASHLMEARSSEPSSEGFYQMKMARSFTNKVVRNKKPNFYYSNSEYLYAFVFEDLERYLILPPTIVEQQWNPRCNLNLIYPKNYVRLGLAKTRAISREVGDEIDEDDDESFIQIKLATDDPADKTDLPLRTSKSGKQVKDASSQATQSLHDFGMPWDQLLDYGDDSDDELILMEEVDENGTFIGMPGTETRLQYEADQKLKHEAIAARKSKLETACHGVEHSDLNKSSKAIPQLRCLMNYTPPTLRSSKRSKSTSKRHTKRRNSTDDDGPSPSTKRRRSQPNPCNVCLRSLHSSGANLDDSAQSCNT